MPSAFSLLSCAWILGGGWRFATGNIGSAVQTGNRIVRFAGFPDLGGTGDGWALIQFDNVAFITEGNRQNLHPEFLRFSCKDSRSKGGLLAMTDGQPFVDFYSILQVHPECDAEALETAYRRLAKMYHPDHPETANVDKFSEVVTAYRSLRNPEDRAKYDLHYAESTGFEFSVDDARNGDEGVAVSDADAHAKALMFLYKRRREFAQDAGVGRYFVQQFLNCSDESFDFHIWYLKEKGFVEVTEQGMLAITIQGVDHVISMSRQTVHEKLRIAQSKDSRHRP